jgi:hypothetical protein
LPLLPSTVTLNTATAHSSARADSQNFKARPYRR